MKSKLFIAIFLLVAFICIPIITRDTDKVSHIATGAESAKFMSYNAAINSSKPTVILFYANWCSYCRKFMPKFNAVAKDYGDKYDFVKINIEASNSNKSLSEQYNIRSLPTVYIVEPRYKVKKEISPYSYDSVESMRSELKRYLQKRR